MTREQFIELVKGEQDALRHYLLALCCGDLATADDIALSTLPPKERSAVTLYYLTGYSVKEIATISNSTEDAVKKQLSRGRDKLKSRLKR